MNNIKRYRTSQNLSQIELSNLSGVPVQTLRDWEQERKEPTNVYQIHKVAKVLGCTIEQLIVFE